jgi:predicted nucleic acid-binding protein
VTLVDTSAWIEFLRATHSPTHVAVRRSIEAEVPLATTDVIVMELLAGARSESHAQELRRFLLGLTHLPVRGLADFESAS